MLVDSHCHLDQLDLTPYGGDLSKALLAAAHNDVGYMLCVCIDLIHFPAVRAIAETAENVSATFGLHPNDVVPEEPSLESLIPHAQDPLVVGIGETGLDYYRTSEEIEWQRDRFRRFIQLAKQVRKPLIIHSRHAREDTLQILKEERAEEVGGVLHCFTEDWAMAKKALDMGFYISFSGIITFKNAEALREVAQQVPLTQMLIETDAPYLAPDPYRGKPNEPAYVRFVAEKIAELHAVSLETVAEHTTKNFFTLFNIPPTMPALLVP